MKVDQKAETWMNLVMDDLFWDFYSAANEIVVHAG